MISLKEWQELCVEGKKAYYWDKDTVVICDAKDLRPSYTEDYLQYSFTIGKLTPEKVYSNQKDCVLGIIKNIKEEYHSILIGGC